MKKTILDQDAGSDLFDDVDTAYSRGVMVEAPGYKRLFLSGVTSTEEAFSGDYEMTIYEQTRDALERIEAFLDDFGASMDDVVRVRVYVEDLAEEDFPEIHRARSEFFDREHYPASSLLEVEGVLLGRIEIECEVVVPTDGEWEVETIESDIPG